MQAKGEIINVFYTDGLVQISDFMKPVLFSGDSLSKQCI